MSFSILSCLFSFLSAISSFSPSVRLSAIREDPVALILFTRFLNAECVSPCSRQISDVGFPALQGPTIWHLNSSEYCRMGRLPSMAQLPPLTDQYLYKSAQ